MGEKMIIMLLKVLRKISLFVAFFCVSNYANAQDPNYMYYFNVQLESVAKEYASIIGKGYKMDNSVLVDYYQIADNKMILTIEYTDSTLRVDNGIFQSYHNTGLFENNGSFINGKENGLWMKYDSLGRTLDSINYAMGKMLTYRKQTFHKDGYLVALENCDSIAGTLSVINYDSLGSISRTYMFSTPNKGIATYYENGSSRTELLTTQARKEAEYPGGPNGWRRFLEKNVSAMYLLDKGAPAGYYQATIKFIVNEDGTLSDFEGETDLGYGLENELISKMKNGVKWIPSTMFGKKVKAYRRQPITMFVPND